MLHIILFILKIIGIVLLCILGLILLLLVCVLFVPVRYRIRVSRTEGEGSPPVEAYVKVTWLLHLLNVLARYPCDVIVRVRVMFFTLFRMPEKEKKTGKPAGEPLKEPKKQPEPEKEETGPAADTVVPQSYEPYSAFENGPEPVAEPTPEESGPQEPSSSVFAKIRAVFAKIGQLLEKIKGFFQNIRYTIRKICDKIKAVSDNIQYYREVMEGEPFRNSLSLCRGELTRVFRMLKPDKLEADFVVGMEDPSATGRILAVYGMLYPLIGQHVRIAGDFECAGPHVEGQLHIRGKVRIFTLLRAGKRIYFNRDVRKLIRLLKKEAA